MHAESHSSALEAQRSSTSWSVRADRSDFETNPTAGLLAINSAKSFSA